MSWLDASISLFRGATDAQPVRPVTTGAVLEAIRTSAYRAPLERLRYLRTTQGQAAYNAAKQRLDAVTFGGTFAPKRSKTTLMQHSGLVHSDIDHLADVQTMKVALGTDAHVAYCFVSPSGDGLKLGVLVAPVIDHAAYGHAWQVVAAYFFTQYDATITLARRSRLRPG
jgi:VirE N-terminal domain